MLYYSSLFLYVAKGIDFGLKVSLTKSLLNNGIATSSLDVILVIYIPAYTGTHICYNNVSFININFDN